MEEFQFPIKDEATLQRWIENCHQKLAEQRQEILNDPQMSKMIKERIRRNMNSSES
jgi:hypothetical protein